MSQDKRIKEYHFRLNHHEDLLFKNNFAKSGLNSRAEFTRRLVTTYEVPCKLDFMKLMEFRRIAAALGRNNGLLKIYVLEMSVEERTEYHINRIDQIVQENEKIKEDILEIIKNFKDRGY